MLDVVCSRFHQPPSDYLEKHPDALLYDFIIATTGISVENSKVDEDSRATEMKDKLAKFKGGK